MYVSFLRRTVFLENKKRKKRMKNVRIKNAYVLHILEKNIFFSGKAQY